MEDMQNILALDQLGAAQDDEMRGKYLIMTVHDGSYGIEIEYITEIIKMQTITNVPHSPHYVKGIINLRNTIVPVIDMGMRFGQPEIEVTDRTCIIVLSLGEMNIGLIVDEVQEVLSIDDEELQAPPKARGDRMKNEFVKNICMSGDNINQLLDVSKVFEAGEFAM